MRRKMFVCKGWRRSSVSIFLYPDRRDGLYSTVPPDSSTACHSDLARTTVADPGRSVAADSPAFLPPSRRVVLSARAPACRPARSARHGPGRRRTGRSVISGKNTMIPSRAGPARPAEIVTHQETRNIIQHMRMSVSHDSSAGVRSQRAGSASESACKPLEIQVE